MPEANDYSAPQSSDPVELTHTKLRQRLLGLLRAGEAILDEVTLIGEWDRPAGITLLCVPPDTRHGVLAFASDQAAATAALVEWADEPEAPDTAKAYRGGDLPWYHITDPRVIAVAAATWGVQEGIFYEGTGEHPIDVLEEWVPSRHGAPLEYASALMEAFDYEGVWLDLQPFPLGRLLLRVLRHERQEGYERALEAAGDL